MKQKKTKKFDPEKIARFLEWLSEHIEEIEKVWEKDDEENEE